MRWATNQRVPLIFWFPNRDFANHIKYNVQNLDIAPTLLDYLGVRIPKWMGGHSLLEQNLNPAEYIFSASVESSLVEVTKEGLWAVEMERRSPPFFQLGYVGFVICDQWYELYVYDPKLLFGEVKGHTAPCDTTSMQNPERGQQILLNYLLQNGYDVSSLPSSIPFLFIE